jgi:hypothetical protein
MPETNYHIRRLNPATELPDYGVVPFIGATSSGKTSLMLDILYHVRHRFERVVVICGSKDTEEEFKQHVSDLCIWDKFDADRLNAIYEQQERLVALKRPKPLLVILDDMMFQARKIQKEDVLSRIFFNGRHARILFFVSLQYCKSLQPGMRQQARMVFAMAEKNPANRAKLYDAFNNCFNSKDEFDALMQVLTKDWQAMVLTNMATGSSEVADNVFWYKAQLGHRFKVDPGGLMWRIHKSRYDPRYFMREPGGETFLPQKKKRGRVTARLLN